MKDEWEVYFGSMRRQRDRIRRGAWAKPAGLRDKAEHETYSYIERLMLRNAERQHARMIAYLETPLFSSYEQGLP